jgi:FkbM family methyltransferase
MRNQAYDIRLADLTARLDDVVGDHQAASRQRLAADIARARADVEAAEQRTAALTHAALSSLDPSGGGRQQAQAEFLTAALRPGDTFVDIGAHVGWHAAVAARAVGPSGHVIAVEPSPDVLAVLRRNLEDGLPDTAVVSVQPVAAWDEDAALTFVVSTDDPAGGRTFPAALDRDGDKVEGRRLDTLEALSDHTVAAVRTDVGGAEHRTLRGLRKTIERDRPVVLTEFAPERILELGDDPAAVLAEWADMGYAISLLPGDASATVDAAEIVRAAGSGSVSLCLTPLDPGHDPLAS